MRAILLATGEPSKGPSSLWRTKKKGGLQSHPLSNELVFVLPTKSDHPLQNAMANFVGSVSER